MKKLQQLFLAFMLFALTLSTTKATAQLYEYHTRAQVFKSVPIYSTGGNTKMVWNTTSNAVESTSNTVLSGVVTTETEKDSARKYTHQGYYTTYIKWTVRDTINLTSANYTTNQLFRFKVIATGADTTVFIPSSGTIDGAANYTLTGTNAYTMFWFDGTNYWITK